MSYLAKEKQSAVMSIHYGLSSDCYRHYDGLSRLVVCYPTAQNLPYNYYHISTPYRRYQSTRKTYRKVSYFIGNRERTYPYSRCKRGNSYARRRTCLRRWTYT